MRVVGGKYKRKQFAVPRTFKARPTTDFAKENLFNILSNVYLDFDEDEIEALDLFGGTGSIGLEFVSRGCKKVVTVEKDFKHYQFISKVSHELNDKAWMPVHADVFKYLQRCSASYDVVFADPPYALEHLTDIPRIILESNVLKEDGILILEHGKTDDFSSHPCLIDHREYGSVNFSIFRKTSPTD